MVSFVVGLHICFVLAGILWLAGYFKVRLVEAMPVFVCMLVLVLYGLAMLRHLSWIDGIAGVTVVLSAVWIVSRKKEKRGAVCRLCLEKIADPSFVAAAALLLVVTVCVSGKAVSWWDDINFWATDVRSLYYLDGFAQKYGNVAPEFGDYPPGAQLIKWWFLHFDPHTFREGLAFAGYYVMNLVFLLPLLRALKGRNVVVMFLMAAALWFFPSIAEVYGYDGFCADLTMACIYGGFLLAVTDKGEQSGRAALFYYGRLALYLGVLVLVKSIGFVWALFGLLFLALYQRDSMGCGRRRDRQAAPDKAAGKSRMRHLLMVAAVPLLTGGSWMMFCLLMRRITKTTATAVKYMTTDEYGISGYAGEFAAAFLRAFVGFPLHKDKTPALDLTPLGLYLCICLLVVLFYRVRLLPEKTGRAVLVFCMVSGAVFYGIIFLAHITIFATETQYLEPSGMISSIERYGAPFTIGTLLFLAGIWLSHGERFFEKEKIPAFLRRYGVCLSFILFVALTAGYRVGYHGLIGYRQDAEQQLADRTAMIGADEQQFLEVLQSWKQAGGAGGSARVCYIRRGDTPRWVNNSYLGYEASPVSMVYRSVNLDDAPTEWMVQEIRTSHADYLYAEETEADAGAVFDGITESGPFACGVLYRILETEAGMKLVRAEE